MPLSVNVGLSRKASKDFQSSGVSVNVTAELDQALLARPEELHKQIGQLYAQAESALDRQADRMVVPDSRPRREEYRRDQRPPLDHRRYDHNGGDRGYGDAGRRPPNGGHMTHSQRRAIQAIADRMGIDPRLESRDIIGVELDELTVRQASELIDHLKAIQPAERSRR